jgi:hypothetical protein
MARSLDGLPTALHQRLKARAESNRRSLNREILALLESQLEAPSVDVAAEQKALEEFVAFPGLAMDVEAAVDTRDAQSA